MNGQRIQLTAMCSVPTVWWYRATGEHLGIQRTDCADCVKEINEVSFQHFRLLFHNIIGACVHYVFVGCEATICKILSVTSVPFYPSLWLITVSVSSLLS